MALRLDSGQCGYWSEALERALQRAVRENGHLWYAMGMLRVWRQLLFRLFLPNLQQPPPRHGRAYKRSAGV